MGFPLSHHLLSHIVLPASSLAVTLARPKCETDASTRVPVPSRVTHQHLTLLFLLAKMKPAGDS